MLQVKDIEKSFGTKKVLKGVSLNVEAGKITSIVGMNGAGKSTLISLVTGYKKIDNGTVEKKTLSVMPDSDNLFKDMTGLYFLKFSANIKKTKITTAEIESLADRLFLKADLKKKIKSYSFGMKKKISFIQAYIGDFDTYIFDEPTSGVDIEAEQAMMDLIEELKTKGKAILLTSHNIEEIERYCDYVYVLDAGIVTKQGTVGALTQTQEENVVVNIDAVDESEIIEILASQKVSKYSFEDNLLTLKMVSEVQMTNIIKQMFAKNVKVKGFWVEKKALREVVFKEVA